ncbi:MAG: hypothetical protein NXI03_11670, partial [Alphaproteobacteria bacterium]|nr:hypothetical protein [Alphaproteobacteria bacterium]
MACRTYETLEYDTKPDNQSGDPVFSCLDHDYDAFGAYSVAVPSGNGEVDGSFEDTTKMDPTPSWGVSGTGGVAPGWTDATGFAVEFQNDGSGGLDATD